MGKKRQESNPAAFAATMSVCESPKTSAVFGLSLAISIIFKKASGFGLCLIISSPATMALKKLSKLCCFNSSFSNFRGLDETKVRVMLFFCNFSNVSCTPSYIGRVEA